MRAMGEDLLPYQPPDRDSRGKGPTSGVEQQWSELLGGGVRAEGPSTSDGGGAGSTPLRKQVWIGGRHSGQ